MNHPNDARRLVPCPFCGGEAERFEMADRAGVRCADIMCAGSHRLPSHGEDYVAAWNRRAAPASPLPEGGGQCSGISGELKSPDLDALEKLADEATPGPWTWDGYGLSSLTTSGPVIHDLGYDGLWIDEKGSDASFIAAANPTTIKALIAELKEARAALEPFADHFVIYQADTPPMTVIPITTEYRHIRRAFLARNGKEEGQ